MPPRTKQKKDDDSYTLTIYRSSGGQDEITIAPNKTLNDLKLAIASSPIIGKDLSSSPKDQRIFHLGRELKTGGRSLEKLGVTRWGVCVLHVHAVTREKEEASVDVVQVAPAAKKPAAASACVIDLASDDDEVVVEEVPTKRQRLV